MSETTEELVKEVDLSKVYSLSKLHLTYKYELSLGTHSTALGFRGEEEGCGETASSVEEKGIVRSFQVPC